MGIIARTATLFLISGYLLKDRVVDEVLDRIEYRFDGFREGDIQIRVVPSLHGVLQLRLTVTQSTGVGHTITGIRLQFRQGGITLGEALSNQMISLPHGEPVSFPLTVRVPAGPFLDRLSDIISSPGTPGLLSPLEVNGEILLTRGLRIPIRTRISWRDLV